MKTKRFQWLSDLRRRVRYNLCCHIRKKNKRIYEARDVELDVQSLSMPRANSNPKIQTLCGGIFGSGDDKSLLILITQKKKQRLPLPPLRRTLRVFLALPWISSIKDITEGKAYTIRILIELPPCITYENMVFRILTYPIFISSIFSYPLFFQKLQLVPYTGQTAAWYVQQILQQIRVSVNRKKAIMRSTRWPLPTKGDVVLDVEWKTCEFSTKKMEIKTWVEDGDEKKIFKANLGDISAVVVMYRRAPWKTLDLSYLKSPYLVQLLCAVHYKQRGERWFMYKEVKYGDLGTLLQNDFERNIFGEREARYVIWKIFLALQYLHGRRVVHGDIRPSKILIDEHGQPLLGGLETVILPNGNTLVSISPQATEIGFVSPEIIQRIGYVPEDSDIFNVGSVAYFIVTGRCPFTTKEVLLSIDTRPSFSNKKFSIAGAKFIGHCLRKPRVYRLRIERNLYEVLRHKWFSYFNFKDDSPSPLLTAIERINSGGKVTCGEKSLLEAERRRRLFVCPE